MQGVLCGNCNAKKALACSKNCVLKTMESLEKYLVYMKTIEARIGQYSSGGELKDKSDYTICGVYRAKGDYSNGNYLTDTSNSLLLSRHFDKYMGINLTKLIDEYVDEKYCGKDAETVRELKSIMTTKMQELNSWKQVITPFDLDTAVKFLDAKSGKMCSGIVTKISYRRDPLTCEVFGEIVVDTEGMYKTGKRVKLKFTDFNKTWELEGMKANRNKSLIELSADGIIHPIEIIGDGNDSIVIDNQFIYNYSQYGYEIVGWIGRNNQYVINDTKSRIPKKIKSVLEENLGYISMLQRYIGVYGIHKVREVRLDAE